MEMQILNADNLYESKGKGKKRIVEILEDYGDVLLLRNIKSKTVTRKLKVDFRHGYMPLVVPFGPEPIAYETDIKKIYNQREGCCLGCKWHPDVCQYCMRSLDSLSGGPSEESFGCLDCDNTKCINRGHDIFRPDWCNRGAK